MSNVTVRRSHNGTWRVFVDDHEVTKVQGVKLSPGFIGGIPTVTLTLLAEDFLVAHEEGMEPVKINQHPAFGFDLDA